MARTPYLTARMQGFGTTIFDEMTGLAKRHDAINLGQGFPDFAAPSDVTEAAVAAIRAGHNQYAPGIGILALRQAVAAHQQRFWDLDYDADTQVTITAGATEALCATLLALCEVGDEIVVFEPFFDAYLAGIAMAGAVPRVVPLEAPGFTLDPARLAAAVTPRTRLILLNSPHNPTGKVFTPEELAGIAGVCCDHDLIAVTDEVYEHLVYNAAHIPLATLPGMAARTVQISSAAKTFSVTGWKTGWICAPPLLTTAIRAVKQFVTYTNGTPFQHAIASALAMDDMFFTDLGASYAARRIRLASGLRDIGFTVLHGEGSYFVVADIGPLGFSDGVEFCRELPAKVGVAAIPVTAFALDPARLRRLVRFAFCKTDAAIDQGLQRLGALSSS